MSGLLPLGLAWAAGMALGLFYFGGLWLTVRHLPTSRSPALLTLGSFLGRTVATLTGFYLVMGGHWERLLACFVGFLLMRTILVARWRPEEPKEPAEEHRTQP